MFRQVIKCLEPLTRTLHSANSNFDLGTPILITLGVAHMQEHTLTTRTNLQSWT
jgi:hypothetical protein